MTRTAAWDRVASAPGRVLWLVPSTFVLVMAVGGAFGVLGVNRSVRRTA